MHIELLSIATLTGLILFIINYITGWLLNFRIIKLTRLPHQVMYSLLLINILILLFLEEFLTVNFILYLLVIILLAILPFGKKGGNYHKIISSIAVIVYILALLIV